MRTKSLLNYEQIILGIKSTLKKKKRLYLIISEKNKLVLIFSRSGK